MKLFDGPDGIPPPDVCYTFSSAPLTGRWRRSAFCPVGA